MNIDVTEEMAPIQFDSIFILCLRKEDIPAKDKKCDLNVCVAFDLYTHLNGKLEFRTRAVSTVIRDSREASKMEISEMSRPSSAVDGQEKILLFCNKVQKNDVIIQFVDVKNNVEHVWQTILPERIHYRVAIMFRAPIYHTRCIDKKVKTFIRLRRPSDSQTSPLYEFEYYPQGESLTYDQSIAL